MKVKELLLFWISKTKNIKKISKPEINIKGS